MGKAESLVGAEFDGYRIKNLLGQGAMGAVYEALDLGLKRKVAIKVLAESVNRNPDAVKRFIREAKAIGSVAHINVAQVYRVGTFRDLHYYAMEYIDGQSLEQMTADGARIRGRRAFDLMLQAVRGLKAAADSGVIHRDVKPANLMVTRDGTLKVVDFGIAKMMDESESLQTATGTVMGTPSYMSPEQCRGQKVDVRSDIYSLGCTFFHMLTGHPPFDGDTLYTVMERQIGTPVPSITSLAPNVPDRLCNIIYTMVEKNPDNRYQTYEQLLTVLEAASEGRATILTAQVVDESEVKEAAGEWRKLKLIYLAAGLAVALMIAWIAFSGKKKPEAKRAAPAQAVHDEKPEGGLSRVAHDLQELNKVDKEVRKDARELY